MTLVKLPGKDDSVRIYGFLGLDPDRDFVTRDERPVGGVSPWAAVLISVLVLMALWFLILALYVIECCMPQEWNWSTGLPFLAGGAVLGAIGLMWLTRLDQKNKQEQKGGGWFLAVCGAVLGTLAGAITLGAVNSAFDHTQPTYNPIRLQKQWQTTHNLIFRTYEVEYTPLAGGKSEKHGLDIDGKRKLEKAESALAALEIRQGALGLDWFAGVHPVDWEVIDGEPTAEDMATGVEARVPIGGVTRSLKLAPRLLVAAGDQGKQLAPCPPELVEAAIAELIASTPPGGKVERLKK